MAEEKEQNLSRFLQDLFNREEDEIHCHEAGDLMVRAANAQLMPEALQEQYPALWHHFEVCPDCTQEYELLLELMRRELAGELESPPHLPALPDGGGAAVWQWAREAITAVFPGFAPELATAVTRGQALLFAPVAVSLWDGRLVVEFDLAPHEDDPQYRDLYVTMSSADDSLAAMLDGITLWLQKNEIGPAVYEETLLAGDAIFARVSPGDYSLRWRLAGHDCAVRNIHLP